MTLFGLIMALILLMVFSPVFSYIHSRQSITVGTENINTALKSYSESAFNELFDEAKNPEQLNGIYYSLIGNKNFKDTLIENVLSATDFKLIDENENKYKSNGNVSIYDPIIIFEKQSNVYTIKMLYDIEVPLKILGINVYNYKNTYIGNCSIRQNLE